MIPATYVGVRTYPTDARYGRTRHTCPPRWLPVPGAERDYEVSETGQVRRASPARGTVVGRVLNPRVTQERHHLDLRLSNGCRMRIYVDEAVCAAFRGSAPAGPAAVLHIDRDLLNDNASNLRWTDPVTAVLEHRRHPTDSGCWNWTGAIHTGGYGCLNHSFVHRMSYEHYIGPIPDGLHIDHLCRNRRCFNPEHLEAVEPAENTRRGNGWTMLLSRQNRCSRGHELTAENTYIRPDGTRRACRACERLRNQVYRAGGLCTSCAAVIRDPGEQEDYA